MLALGSIINFFQKICVTCSVRLYALLEGVLENSTQIQLINITKHRDILERNPEKMTPLRSGQGELRWAGNSQLPKQPMHSSGSAGVSSGWHLDPTLQTKWRFEHPNGLSWLQQASWFHMDLVPALCYLRRATEQHTFLFHYYTSCLQETHQTQCFFS